MAIPIIGQPRVGEFQVTFIVECPCSKTFLFSGVPGSMRPCGGPECKRIYKLLAWPTVNPVTGDIDAPLGVAYARLDTPVPPTSKVD
jgi:hypothetical protein